jgi:hypothetical protein
MQRSVSFSLSTSERKKLVIKIFNAAFANHINPRPKTCRCIFIQPTKKKQERSFHAAEDADGMKRKSQALRIQADLSPPVVWADRLPYPSSESSLD